ncbi:FAD dependent oxidoreductase [Sporobacter termitidis DSM 10068]|uniref:FAD dependent oxidoreductase n=1 Tax=Sporobacter termitidis DSM 10068 TaxID=1123282 RepID=A0A1M5Z7T5_9FIRM|nr:FAD-dependent oxidoreductase [Sporobacter termitidis]SHI20309.1 FAD dependent oxidoreductase [Sporobacter termitidis DSM 10068]
MNGYIVEREKKTEITRTTEVLVAGGGIAGIAAAIAAARNGKKVVLLEREYALGGMATLGLVTIYLPLCDGEGRQLVFGIGEELLKLSIAHGAEANHPHAWLDGDSLEERIKNRYMTQFNPHLFALRAEALLLELGVTVLYGTLACAVTTEGGAITSVVVENKSGRSAIAVESVIDCTGDADICHLAGARTALHDGGNGLASWYYYFSGGKVSLKMFGLADVVPGRATEREAGGEQNGFEAVKVESLDKNVRFSGVDGEELSRAVIAGHGKMLEDIMSHRRADEAFVPVTISTIPLVRMSRRLVGTYTLDETESRKFMPDSIGMTGDWRKRGPAYELPFRALYGTEVKNLLAAGRDISVTDAMWDITRVIPPCAVTGEAAGMAAAIGSDFARLDVAELQKRLTAQGVKLHLD